MAWRFRRIGVDRSEGQRAGLGREHADSRTVPGVVDLSSKIFLSEAFPRVL
jgi:hypothetical protein